MNKRTLYIDKEGLKEFNKMKPAARQALGITARIAVKMMKMIVKTAFYLPGFVRRLAESHTQEPDKKRSSSATRIRVD